MTEKPNATPDDDEDERDDGDSRSSLDTFRESLEDQIVGGKEEEDS